MPTEKQIARILDALRGMAFSSKFHNFKIGFTSGPAERRAREYRGKGFSHLVLLADKMSATDALMLEERLLRALTINKKSVLYRKWNVTQKDKPYSQSRGGLSNNGFLPVHSVYVAWCDRP